MLHHPQTAEGMVYSPYCPVSDRLGSPLYVVTADEVLRRGKTWETVMEEELMKIQVSFHHLDFFC